MLAHYETRRKAMVEGLAAIPGVRCPMPEGAFYAFADVSALYPRKGVTGIRGVLRPAAGRGPRGRGAGRRLRRGRLRAFLVRDQTDRIREGVKRIAAWAAA